VGGSALGPRDWGRDAVARFAGGSENAGARSPTRRAADFAGVDALPQAAPAVATIATAATRSDSHLGLISIPPGWPDGAETPRRRSLRERGVPPGSGRASRHPERAWPRPTPRSRPVLQQPGDRG